MLVTSLKSKANSKRTLLEKTADFFTEFFGSFEFLLINLGWFTVWIVINLGLVPGIEPFDPFPFGFLTMVVSLEAIFLSIIVLISQNREESINDIRQEADLQLDILTEKEITKILELLSKIAEKQGIDTKEDKALSRMLKPMDMTRLEKKLEAEIKGKPQKF